MAGAAAADRVRSTILAFQVAGADHARFEVGELALAVKAAPPPAAGIEHRALVVALAASGTARTFAALEAGQAVDDRFDAHPVQALNQHARIVVLAAAIPMVRAWPHAIVLDADVVLRATARTLGLRRSPVEAAPREGRRRSGQDHVPKASPLARRCQQTGHAVETVWIHRWMLHQSCAGQPTAPGRQLRSPCYLAKRSPPSGRFRPVTGAPVSEGDARSPGTCHSLAWTHAIRR